MCVCVCVAGGGGGGGGMEAYRYSGSPNEIGVQQHACVAVDLLCSWRSNISTTNYRARGNHETMISLICMVVKLCINLFFMKKGFCSRMTCFTGVNVYLNGD